MFGLAYSAIAPGAAAVLLLQSVSAAPVSTLDWSAAEPPSAAAHTFKNPSATEESPKEFEITPLYEEFLPTGSVGGPFDTGGIDFGISDDKSAIQITPAATRTAISGARGAGGDDCRVLPPGDDSEIFSMRFLGLAAWALVIILAAGSYDIYRRWRTRRWVHRWRGRSPAAPGAARRVKVTRRSKRARPRLKSRPRPYAS